MYNVTKEDIIFIINDICKNDVPFWNLDFGYLKEGLSEKQQKEWAIECLSKAVEIIQKSNDIN